MYKNLFLKKILLCFCFICLIACIFAQEQQIPETKISSYTKSANYRTALRCLDISKDFMSRSEWNNAFMQAELGCRYNHTISDLWYVCAEAKFRSGAILAEVLPFLEKAFENNNWVDTNYDNARLLYAKVLSDTRDPAGALVLLESEPFLYSAEAEYLRILSYYRLGTDESYKKAREKVSAAVRLFPEDLRFPTVFFEYELKKDLSFDSELNSFVEWLISAYEITENVPVNFAIYKVAFAQGDEQKRLLKSFNAMGFRHPLYAILGLKIGAITEKDAYNYFCSFLESSVNIKLLNQFLNLLSDKSICKAFADFLNAYNGTLTQDISEDGIVDLITEYRRGRPYKIYYDINQNGSYEWIVDCDYGVPTRIFYPEENTVLQYKHYPYILEAKFDEINVNLISDILEWSPVSISSWNVISEKLNDLQFFVPKPIQNQNQIDLQQAISFASSLEVPTKERENAFIRFAILDGKPRLAQYFSNQKMYAQLFFESGLPSLRVIDSDLIEGFEKTLIFGFSPDKSLSFQSKEDEDLLYADLFASLNFPKGIYIKAIQIDENLDTKIDYKIDFYENYSNSSTWFNNEGQWICKYDSFPIIEDGENNKNLIKVAFYVPIKNEVVSITLENKLPMNIEISNMIGETLNKVEISEIDNVYWIGTVGSSEMSNVIKNYFNNVPEQGKSVVLEVDNKLDGKLLKKRFAAINIADLIFGILIDE